MNIVGTGTGRCGTKSLAKILGITHEAHRLRFGEHLQAVVSGKPTKFEERKPWKNDASYVWLWYAKGIMADPKAKIIVVYRNPQDTVESFKRWGSDRIARTRKVRRYVDLCHAEIERVVSKWPQRIRVFDLEDLNTHTGVRSITAFAGVQYNPTKVGTRLNASTP